MLLLKNSIASQISLAAHTYLISLTFPFTFDCFETTKHVHMKFGRIEIISLSSFLKRSWPVWTITDEINVILVTPKSAWHSFLVTNYFIDSALIAGCGR